jgi:hypothetical protein
VQRERWLLASDARLDLKCNWRRRGVPKAWEQVLRYKYKKQIAEAAKMV